MKKLLLLPLLSCAMFIMIGCASVGANRLAVKNITISSFPTEVDKYDVRSFEPNGVCDEFILTEAEVLEFFTKARLLSSEEREKITHGGKESVCKFVGHLELKDGSRGFWRIDRARNATLVFSPANNRGHEYYHCDTCSSQKYYSASGQEFEMFRPVVKKVTIEGQSCLALSEAEVLEFFNVAQPSSFMNMTTEEEFDDTERSRCYLSGSAELQGGKTVVWSINQLGYGVMRTGETGADTLHYYGRELFNTLRP